MCTPKAPCLILALAATAAAFAQTPSFVENFNGSTLDTTKWRIDEGPRKGAVNTTRALTLRNGVLRITTFTENDIQYTGFVDTFRKFSQVTGRFEARIRFSPQPGMWSAFWSMSPTYGDSGDPALATIDGVEMDIVEHLLDMGGTYDTTIHWGGYGPPNQRTVTQRNAPALAANFGWHDYAVEWDKDGYRFFYDSALVWTAPDYVPKSRARQHMILSSEVQDGGWAGNVPVGGYGAIDASNAWVEFDWVKAWPGPSSITPLASTAGSTPLTGKAPLTVNFSGQQSVDVDGSIVSYEWSFSDGRTATGATPSLTFPTPGTYTATLTVTDDAGNQDDAQVVINVSDRTVANRPMYVGSGAVRWVSYSRTSSLGQATIRVCDTAGRPLPGVTVDVSVSGLATAVLSGVTDRAGNVVLSTSEVANSSRGSVVFTVRGATLGGYAYLPTMNRVSALTLRR